jgi:pimeloyl-ACP methyl ester carboxylesterase
MPRMLTFDRRGTGRPLVLLHGIGSHRHVWAPVVGHLEARRDVIAVDLPGFGDSPTLPAGVEPTPAALADAVSGLLDELGLDAPDVGGNSLGGWIALELARRGRVRAAVALSPAGFWTARERAYAVRTLTAARRSARLLLGRVDALARSAAFRHAGTWTFAAHGERQPPEATAAALRALALAPGWEPTLAALARGHFTGGRAVPTSATVAWADRDRLLLPRQAERARAAAPRARHVRLRDCGHVPTWDDPAQVAAVLAATD